MLFSLYSDLSCFYLTSFMYSTRNQFLLDSTHLNTLHNVLLLTCSIAYLLFLLWIYGTLNKTFANHLQNFIQHPALKVNSICEGNYRGLSMWLSTQQVDY